MRIVTANNFYYLRGGSERVLLDQECALRSAGHEVLPFSTIPLGTKTTSHSVERCDVNQLSMFGKVKAIPGFIHNRVAGRAFGRLLDDHRPDIIHCHNIYGSLTTSILVEAQRRGIPAIMTAHDAKLVCPSYLCLDHGEVCEACQSRRYYHCLLKRCHKSSLVASAIYTAESYFNKWLKRWEILKQVITPSRFLKSLLEKSGYPADWITYLPNAVDVKSFAPAFTPGDYILYAGRLSKEKGVLTLLEALKGTGIPMRIAGDGPVRTDAERFVADHKLPDVRFEGYQSGESLANLFRGAAFLAIPSEWYENAPMTVLEAFAHGKPVLGANIGGVSELVRSGETGVLFEPRNVDQLRSSLKSFWAGKSELEEMGRNARGLVEQQFSLERHCEGLMAIYRRCIK